MIDADACTLGDVLTLQRGFDITKAAQRPGRVPVVSSSGINSFHDTVMVCGPGVVVGRKGSLGTCFYLNEDFWPHDTSLWVKDFKGNDPRYCYYLLKSMNLGQYDVGSANPTLNRNHVHVLPVARLSRAAQEAVVPMLAAYDDLIEVNRRRIALLESMARELFEEWFVRFRFPGHEQSVTPATSELQMPDGWRSGEAAELVSFDPTMRLARQHSKPFLSMAELDTTTSLTGDFSERTGNSGAKFRNGDTLFARITPCLENGKTGLVRGLTSEQPVGFGSTEFIVMRGQRAGPAFTYSLARHDGFRRFAQQGMSGASGRQRVATSKLRTFQLAVPPDDDLLRQYEEVAGPMLELVGQLGAANRRLTAARDLLLPRLLSGRLTLRTAERELADAA